MIAQIVNKQQAVFLLATILIFIGVKSYNSLPRESSPEIKRPMIFIITEYPGVSAYNVEEQVTKPIEREVDGLPGLERLTSKSRMGFSSITAEFDKAIDTDEALRKVQERVDILRGRLPAIPDVRSLNFANRSVIDVTVTNPHGLEVLEKPLKDLIEDIEKISEVKEVEVAGEIEKEVTIEVNPRLLRHYGLTFEELTRIIRSENINIPGGTFKNNYGEKSIAISGEFKDVHSIENLIVSDGNIQVKLKDVAKIKFAEKEKLSYARADGAQAVNVEIKKRIGANMITLSEKVHELVDKWQKNLPIDTKVIFAFDLADYVNEDVTDLENNIFTSTILVVLVTFFFLGLINASFVTLTIPFSMLLSFLVISAVGITLNVVVLFALILSLGMLVDNGIVTVENIYRYHTRGLSKVDSAIRGTKEVAIPIATSTLTTILAFFPVIFMPGIMGEFLSYIPKTVIIVLLSSLIVALTITPAVCSKFIVFRMKDWEAMAEGSGFFFKMQGIYEKYLRKALKWPLTMVIIGSLLTVGGIALNFKFGKPPLFFPILDPSRASIVIETKPGTSLETTLNIAKKVEERILDMEGPILLTKLNVGQSESSLAQVNVAFLPYFERKESTNKTIKRMRGLIDDISGAKITLMAGRGGPSSGNDISYKIQGIEYDKMEEITKNIEDIMNSYQGAFESTGSDLEDSRPEILVDIDRAKAARYGINSSLVAETIRTAFNGKRISTFRAEDEEYPIILRFDKESRENQEILNSLDIPTPGGGSIVLSSIAKIVDRETLRLIKREDQRRAISVWGNFRKGYDKRGEVKKEITKKVKELHLDSGYEIVAGQGEKSRNESQEFLIFAFILALLLVFIVLVIQFNSMTQPLIIMMSVFLSLGGVFWGIFLTGQEFVIVMSGIGVISLAGIVVNNAIVLIDFINSLRKNHDIDEAVVQGGITRLRPVLLTALTTVIGLVPMALRVSFDFYSFSFIVDSPSSAYWQPMASVIIYGMSFATFLTLILVPSLVLLDHRVRLKLAKVKERFISE